MSTKNAVYIPVDQATTTSLTSSIGDIVETRQNRRSNPVYSTYIPNKRFSRYNNTLRTLFPFGLKKNDEKIMQNSGLFSFMTFHWILKYLWQNNNQTGISIPLCPKSESCTVNSPRLNGIIDAQVIIQGQNNLSVFILFWKFIRTRTIFACILYILGSLMSIFGLVYLLPHVLYNEIEQNALFYMSGLVCTEIVSNFLKSFSNAINLSTAIRLRSASFSSLFRQAMNISLTHKLTSWQLASFLLLDGQHIQDLVTTFPNLICTPFTLCFCMLFAGVKLELWGYISVAVIIIFFPIFILLALFSKNLLYRATFFSDERIKLIEEFINHNIYVKLFKQENWFKSKIAEKRGKEVNNLQKIGLYDNICFSFISLQPFLSLVALFIAYYTNVTAEKQKLAEFASISIILLIHVKQSLDNFWFGLNNFIKGLTALNKLKRIMTCDTIYLKNKNSKHTNIVINIEDANFQWTKQVTLDTKSASNILCTPKRDYIYFKNIVSVHDILHDINLTIERGKLIGICGMPGSGKSSLLLAIMGLLLQSKGKKKINGRYAYVTQDPIILHDSLKYNILFDNELDTQRYFRVTLFCELHDFISSLPEQDDTIIESKMLTLEQKQRIVLARALYEDGDIYLLDKPLSALDSQRRSKIFDTCVIKSLNPKTVLLVTDEIEFLQQCDEVYMLEHGKILLKGKHEKLINTHIEYNNYIHYLKNQKNVCKEKYNFFEISTDTTFADKLSAYIRSNDMVSLSDSFYFNLDYDFNISEKKKHENKNVVHSYISNFGVFSVIFLFLTQVINATFISFLPVYFIYSLEDHQNIIFLSLYFGLFLWMLIFDIFINYFFNKVMFTTSKMIYKDLLEKIFNATLTFFKKKSLSIISYISMQLHLTDIEIPRLLQSVFINLIIAVMSTFVIYFASPWFAIPVVIIFSTMSVLTILISKKLLLFNHSGLAYNEILYTQISTMLMARPIIQAHNKIIYFSNRLYKIYDGYIIYLYILNAAKCWLNFVLQSLSVLLFACVGFISIFFPPSCIIGDLSLFSNSINSTSTSINSMEMENKQVRSLSCTALAIVCILQACYTFQNFLLNYLDSTLAFDILSKVEAFKTNINQEVNKDEEDQKVLLNTKPLSITFSNVTLNSDRGLVFNDISFTVKENKKMGFVGLTSTERQAIISVIYKLTDILSGNVLIDKENIRDLSTKNLRSLVNIVPSEPYFFNSSVKNILLNNGYSGNIIDILKTFYLLERINSLPSKENSIADHWLNAEEKQMLCLARIYLESSPIIIIEDFVIGSYLDQIIRTQIKELFPQSTILIFTNDVNSLKSCDTITVFENGQFQVIYSTSAKTQSSHLNIFQTKVPETSF